MLENVLFMLKYWDFLIIILEDWGIQNPYFFFSPIYYNNKAIMLVYFSEWETKEEYTTVNIYIGYIYVSIYL
jgi:hypothetical protein